MTAAVPVSPAVTARAPAKVNVHLAVGPLRPDGFHTLRTVYLAVSLYEEVSATSTEAPGITVSISPDSTLDLDGVDIPLDEPSLYFGELSNSSALVTQMSGQLF